MNEILVVTFVALGGFFLGSLFFGGLWITVNKGMNSKNPAVLFLLSFLVRTAITASGFYLICGDQWQRFILCLVGFLIARFVVSKVTQTVPGEDNKAGKEVEV